VRAGRGRGGRRPVRRGIGHAEKSSFRCESGGATLHACVRDRELASFIWFIPGRH